MAIGQASAAERLRAGDVAEAIRRDRVVAILRRLDPDAVTPTVDALLQGDQGFYELVEESLQLSAISYQVVKAAPAAKREEAAGPVAPEMLYHVAAAMALVKAFRMHGHLAAQLDPLGTPPIGDPALDPGPLGLTPEVMAAIPSKRRDLRGYSRKSCPVWLSRAICRSGHSAHSTIKRSGSG